MGARAPAAGPAAVTLPAGPITYVAAASSLVVVIAIGAWAARRTHGPRDYFLAGQRLGLWVTGLAAASAAFSGFVFLGGPGLVYRMGVAAWFIVLPIGFTPGLLCFVAARRLRALAETDDVLTLPDALAARFGGRAVRGAAAIAILAGTVGYLGVQVLAAGRLLETVLGLRELAGAWSLPLAMAIGLAAVLAYAVAGGMIAGVYTDVVQGGLMVVAAVALCGAGLSAAGGWEGAVAAILADDRFGPSFLDPLGRVGGTTLAGFVFVFGVGVLGQPHMLHKFMMIRDPERLRFMPVVLGAAQSLCLVVWIGLGLAIPALVAGGRMPAPATPDDAVPAFLVGVAPEALAGLALAGVLAAILSTSDSFVNLGAAAVVRDLPRALGRAAIDDLRRARAATVLLGLAAGALAGVRDDVIALLGTFAFGTFAAALAPVMSIGLIWPRVSARVAATSIAVGTALNLGIEAWATVPGIPEAWRPPLAAGAVPSALALAASYLVLVVGAWAFPAGRDSSRATPAFRTDAPARCATTSGAPRR